MMEPGQVYENTASGKRWEVLGRDDRRSGAWWLQRLDTSARRISRTERELLGWLLVGEPDEEEAKRHDERMGGREGRVPEEDWNSP